MMVTKAQLEALQAMYRSGRAAAESVSVMLQGYPVRGPQINGSIQQVTSDVALKRSAAVRPGLNINRLVQPKVIQVPI